MTKKSELKEWFSKIKHSEEKPEDYSLIFRDFADYVEISFQDFLLRQQEDHIPLHRITQIRKDGSPVFTRPNFCEKCGWPLESCLCKKEQKRS
ncbi:MAG: hypothetical protein ACTSR2_11010 [Candidatus Hodarchaeales archaeon]